jgi:hypothetical protein
MKRPRTLKPGGKGQNPAANNITGKGAVRADARRGRMIFDEELDTFQAVDAFAKALARRQTGHAVDAGLAALGDAQAKKKPPFDPEEAKALLIAKKLRGGWKEPPTGVESRVFLLLHFNGVPSVPHWKVLHEVWPNQLRRGPKPKRKPAK